jgi:hypothetical protein
MNKILAGGLFATLILIGCEKKTLSSPEKPEGSPIPKVVVEKDRGEKTRPLPPEVKIRLKRDGKEQYSWELSSSDVEQLLKVNEELRKGLKKEQSK